MRKKEFLKVLRDNLFGLSQEDVDDIVENYSEHFRVGKTNKRTESEICESLGDPKILAKQAKDELISDDGSFSGDVNKVWNHVVIFSKEMWDSFVIFVDGEYPKARQKVKQGVIKFSKKFKKSVKKTKFSSKVWIFLGLFFLNLLILFPIWISFFSVLISLLVAGVTLVVSGVVSFASIVFALAIPQSASLTSLFLSGLFASIAIFALGFMFLLIFWTPLKFFMSCSWKYLVWNKDQLVDKNE